MSVAMSALTEYYSYLWDIRDRRVDSWPLLSSPWPTVAVSLVYVLFSTVLGPSLMRDRPPFELRRTIMAYNVLQVVMSGYIVWAAWTAGWGTHYSWVCQDVERDPAPDGPGMKMAWVVWMYFASKFVELADTVFFVLKKKFTHVSALQVIHHGIMPVYGYAMIRWLPGGHESFGGFLNSIIHVFMYSYYLLASLGLQKYLWWKRYLTTMQLLQFAVIFTKSMLVVTGAVECGYPWQFSLGSAAVMVVFFALFVNFYRGAYSNKVKDKETKTE